MELSVQDWLIVIGALLIVGVLLDAYRRYRSERRNPIRMGRSRFGMGGGFSADGSAPAATELASTELPNGGARVVRSRDAADVFLHEPSGAQRHEPRLEMGDETKYAEIPDDVPGDMEMPSPAEPAVVDGSLQLDGLTPEGPGGESHEVIVLRVLARDPKGFSGASLVQILRACDVRFGEMNIFHRHEQEKGQGAVQFSIASITEPGSFDIDDMESLATPGLSFFMRLPGPLKPLEAFDCMLETARVIVKNLEGELRDASNSVCTPQTVEQCRKRIRDFGQRSRERR